MSAQISKDVAYVAVQHDGIDGWGISICIADENGHRPLSDYAGPYTEKRAEGIADRLNKRLGISPSKAQEVIASTMKFTRTLSLGYMQGRHG